MKTIKPLILSLLVSIFMPISAQTLVYEWQSPDGTVVETGGSLEHINQNGRNLVNVKCGDYYTFVLNGDFRYINANYNVDECSHMKITLSDGEVFRAGDEIHLTAMRNNVADRPASVCFVFHVAATDDTSESNVPLFDNNVWNNLGLAKDDTFGGGTEKAPRLYAVATDASTFTPSSYTFVVPEDADGADYLRLTRNETGNLLYVSHLAVTRPVDTAISPVNRTSKSVGTSRKYVDGTRGIVIKRGKKLYNTSGAIIE